MSINVTISKFLLGSKWTRYTPLPNVSKYRDAQYLAFLNQDEICCGWVDELSHGGHATCWVSVIRWGHFHWSLPKVTVHFLWPSVTLSHLQTQLWKAKCSDKCLHMCKIVLLHKQCWYSLIVINSTKLQVITQLPVLMVGRGVWKMVTPLVCLDSNVQHTRFFFFFNHSRIVFPLRMTHCHT